MGAGKFTMPVERHSPFCAPGVSEGNKGLTWELGQRPCGLQADKESGCIYLYPESLSPSEI